MKKLIVSSLLALLITAGTTLKAQDRAGEYLGLPGDNLNLYAVMNLFQESQTIEEFEKRLNDEDSKINNLDLNNDNYVDYIMVTDYPDGNVHNIVLQVALGPNDKQDVAVFTVERFNDGSVQIQLIGDDALYGKNYIVEPIYDETPNPGYTGRHSRNRYDDNNYVRTTYFEIAAWPMVRFIYAPGYTVWRSSWYWGYYPVYWHPWTPYYWHYYYGYHSHYYPVYYSHYRIWHTPRYSRYNDYYYHHVRSYSPTVVVNINKGHYKTTYSRPQSRRDGEAYARTHSERSSSYNGSRRTAETRNNGRVNSSNSSRRSSESINNSRPESRSAASRREAPATNSRDRIDRSTPVNRGSSSMDRSSSPSRESGSVRSSSDNRSSGVSRSSSQRSVSTDRSSSERAYRGTSERYDRTYRSAPTQRSSSSGSVSQSRSSSRTETVRSQPSGRSRSESRSSGSRTSSSSSSSTRKSSSGSSDNENSRSRR